MVKFEAEIKFKTVNKKMAKAIALSVIPDNLTAPKGLKVKTKTKNEKIISTVKCEKSFETFLATLDDLVASLHLAEKILKVV